MKTWEEVEPRLRAWLRKMEERQIAEYGHVLDSSNPEDWAIICAGYTRAVSEEMRKVDRARARSRAAAHLRVYV